MAEQATGGVPSSRGEGESQLTVLNSRTSGKESETSSSSHTQGDQPTGNHLRHHIHDAFGNGDIGVDYLFDEDPDENESGMDNENEDHDEIVSAEEPTNRKEEQKVSENHDISITSNDENNFAKIVPIEELEEEVGLHEATLESLNVKLAKLVSEIQLEEKRAGSLRNEIQNLNHRKTHFKKRKDYNVQLIKELENTLNKCLLRLRRVLDASKEVKIDRDPGGCVSGVDSGGDQIELERESDNIHEEADLHFRPIADLSAIGSASANAIVLDCSGGNGYSVDVNEKDQNSKQLTYGEIPLLPCEKATRGLILWPAADLVKEIQSEVENLPCYFPAWRASELSGPLLSGIDSPDLAAKIMHISAVERQMERERLIKPNHSAMVALPAGCGWVNERDIWGTSLDIYTQVNWRPLFSGFRRFGDKQKATSSVSDGIDPNTVLCPYELGGTCADNQCPYQHILDKNHSFKGRKDMHGSIMFTRGKERYIRYHNLPDPVLPPPFIPPNKNKDSGNSGENASGNERVDVPSSLHRRSGRWKGRSDSEVSTNHDNGDIVRSPKKKKQKTYPTALADNPGLNSSKSFVKQKCLKKRTYLCPTCATVALDENALRDHLQECNPNTLVVEGEKVAVNNVLLRKECNSQKKSDYVLEFATITEHRFKREEISEFENNDDFVSLLPFQDDKEEKITGNAKDEGDNHSSGQRLFGNEFWWQNIVPFAKLEGNADDVGVFDSLVLSCGFKKGLSKLDKSHHSLQYIRPPQLRVMNNSEDCEEVLLISRLVDFSRTCIHMGRVSSAIWVLSNCKHTITFSMNEALVEYALDSILQTSSGHSAYGSYRCQICLLVISEFCRDRYNSLCGKNTSNAETSFDVLTNYICYLLRPEQSILQDIAPAGIDHEEALRNIMARVPNKRSTAQRQGARISQDFDSWTSFENALRLLFEDVLDKSFQKYYFSYLLRCLFMGHFLEELVSIVSHEEPTFSPCLHALDPLWRSVQRLVSASVGLFDQGFTCCIGPEIIALVIIGPVIFGCLNSTIAIALDTDEPDVSSDISAPTLDARSIANLSSLDVFIVGVLKEIKTYRRPDGDGGLAAALITPLWSISVTIPVSLGLFEKAQLRLNYAINLKENSKFFSSKPSTLTLNALSGCLWSQLFDLRICFPSYRSKTYLLGNELNFDKSLLPSVEKIHSDISSRAFRNDVILRGVKMRGDKCTELINPLNRKELEKVASQIFQLHTPSKSEVLSCHDIYEEKHNDSFEVNFCGFSTKSNETPRDSVFPESFLLLGKSLKRLKMTNFGLETLPLSLGYHLSRIISLNFAGNLLQEIPLSICHMTLLEEFDASRNRLRRLPKEIVQCVNLRLIDVSNNQIHEFPGNLALDLPRLQTFVIDGNPAHSYVLRKS